MGEVSLMPAARTPSYAPLALAAWIALSDGAAAASPTITAFGAYFPSWLLCLVLGAVAALVTHLLVVRLGLSGVVPLQPLLCLSVGVIVGVLLAAVWLGD